MGSEEEGLNFGEKSFVLIHLSGLYGTVVQLGERDSHRERESDGEREGRQYSLRGFRDCSSACIEKY